MTDISSFTRDRRERVSTSEKVEKRPYNSERRQSDGDRKPYNSERKPYERRENTGERKPFDGERRSYNPNFTRDNRPAREDDRGERRSFNPKHRGDRKPYNSERRQFDGERKPYNSERKPFERREDGGERRTFERRENTGERRPYNGGGELKPYDRREGDGEKRNFERKPYERREDGGERQPYSADRKPFERREYSNGESRPQGERRFKPKYPPRQGGAPRMGAPRRDGAPRAPRDKYDSTNYPKFETPAIIKELRLNRYIAMSGVCSRREADELIAAGSVSVDGVVVTELGTKVSNEAEVRVGDKTIQSEKRVYLVLNKPKGYVTSLEDPHADKTVMDLIKGCCNERVYPVGRLDKNSLGVLLFTNDGDLAKQLTHPSYAKKKIYHVSLASPITKEDMERIVEGIELEDGEIHADEISWVGTSKSEVGIEIHSGRNRIVRRIFDHLGYSVRRLDRVYFAGLTKAKLKRGQWRFLSPKEVEILRSGRYE